MKRFLKFASKSINSILGVVGVKLVRKNAYFSDYRAYISLNATISGARKAGLSVGEYIDVKHNKAGSTQQTIDQMDSLGVFKNKIERVCEIGPGSGRYLEKILQISSPNYYEIYETSTEWQKWLVKKYGVVAKPTDGRSLASTPTCSIDLVHAHKVFPGQPSLVILHYIKEMSRVIKLGGKIVFDIVTEDCMDEVTLETWLKTYSGYQHYPCLMAKQFAVDFLCKQGFSVDGSFLITMKPGLTQYLVFTKQSPC